MPAFEPLLGSEPKRLILGSMPGKASLQAFQYYAHPRNSFWWIMEQLFGVDATAEYPLRVAELVAQRVAVWDVLHDCERHGSLDSSIVSDSVEVNDFENFFRQQPSIALVGFNGAAAAKLFKRHCSSVKERHPSIEWVTLPSTSPAYASITREEKLQLWRTALTLSAGNR